MGITICVCSRSSTDRMRASGAFDGGSIPSGSAQSEKGPVAQLVERCIRIAEVGGSTPLRSTLTVRYGGISVYSSAVVAPFL